MAMQNRNAFVVAVALSLTVLVSEANSQPMGGGRGPGMMMGPHVFGGEGMGRMCGPGSAGFVQWRTEHLDALKLNDAQRAKFDALRAASAKATDTSRAACSADVAATVPGRMEAMEKRMDAMLANIKAVRPALDDFYSSLSAEQKAQLDSGRDRNRFWHHRDRW
jgi:hypothetical protein